MKYAKALINWADKKDPEIAIKLRVYKTYYAQAPLKKLLEYIYKKYPEYATESEVIKKIFKVEKIGVSIINFLLLKHFSILTSS